MAFFPDQVMPKTLRHETSHEVDGDPNILNAADWNRHHREILAIERLLIGAQTAGGAASGVTGFSCYQFNSGLVCPNINLNPNGTNPNAPQSIQDAVDTIAGLVDLITNGGLFAQYIGTIGDGQKVPIPSSIVSTQTTPHVPVAPDATSIPVISTAGFPSQGVITKFNRNTRVTLCTQGAVPPVKGRCTGANNQQVNTLEGLVPEILPYHATNQEFIQYTSITPTSFEGCTRGYLGTTAQDVVDTDPEFNTNGALIISGRASIFFTQNFWNVPATGSPSEVMIEHDALLDVFTFVYKDGTPSGQENISLTNNATGQGMIVGYSLSVIGQFENIDLSGIYNLLEL